MINADRRTFLKATTAAGAAGAVALGAEGLLPASKKVRAADAAVPETRITKSVCHQCPARCGIDVYVT